MSIRPEPLYDRVVIKRDDPSGWSEGKHGAKILLPDGTEAKAMKAVVLEVGPGYRTPEGEIAPLSVEIGDTVLVGKFTGTDFELDGVQYTVLREDEILLILSRNEDEDEEVDRPRPVNIKEIGDRI